MSLLASRPLDEPVPISEMSGLVQVSEKYIEQLLLTLRRSGLVRSMRGPLGGFVLSRSPEKISLQDIMVALQGRTQFCECQNSECRECVRPEVWNAIESCFEATLMNITLKHMVSDASFQLTGRPAVSPDFPSFQGGDGI